MATWTLQPNDELETSHRPFHFDIPSLHPMSAPTSTHQHDLIQPVDSLDIDHCDIEFVTAKTKAWESFKPMLWLDGRGEIEHKERCLHILSGSWVIHVPEQLKLHISGKDSQLRGALPSDHYQLQNCSLQCASHQTPTKTSWQLYQSLCQDLGAIAAFTCLLSLCFSFLFTPPRHLDLFLLASASIYLGINGHRKHALITSLGLGAITLIFPIARDSISHGGFIFEGGLSYLFKITLYLFLWAAGKKLKDWYRGNTI